MAGTFELFVDVDASFRFRLKAPDGTVVALSMAFPDKAAAVAGISAVREYAGMGLITDLCPKATAVQPAAPLPAPRQLPARTLEKDQCAAPNDFHTRLKPVRHPRTPQWSGVA
ncbi:DUF1508 domain-containing protein [Arthrobacter sp. M4]|uniref:YegP family protein n=1 Tax=Arthrobacter sp. M4 TaxID=218160 RepID=UPI001CDD481D|nr:DUF1508 domain-containing protein [Arthrobacter sp. M4]MCA4134070.1 DUF1508 domain-containing protein [Arthrobacter sp. M4]